MISKIIIENGAVFRTVKLNPSRKIRDQRLTMCEFLSRYTALSFINYITNLVYTNYFKDIISKMKTEQAKKVTFDAKKNSNNLEELVARNKAKKSKKSASYTNEIQRKREEGYLKEQNNSLNISMMAWKKRETKKKQKTNTIDDLLSRNTPVFKSMYETCLFSFNKDRKNIKERGATRLPRNIKLEKLDHPFVLVKSLNPYKKLVMKLSPLTPNLKTKVEIEVKKMEQNSEPVFEIVKLNQQDPLEGRLACQKIMNQQITPEEQKKHEEILEKMKEEENTEEVTLPKVVLVLKQCYESNGAKVIFTDKSTFRSRLSLHIITTRMFENIEIFIEVIDENQWDYNDIAYNPESCREFVDTFKKNVSEENKIEPKSIFIHEITGDPLIVKWEANCEAYIKETQARKKFHKHELFSYFQVCLDDFDSRGDMTYGPFPQVDFRGKWPYYLPIRAKRYGLRVSGEYDEGNDDWLKMNGNPCQWAVAFHGVRNISKTVDEDNVLHQILKGRKEGNMLKPGQNQVYENDQCINKPDQKISKGIYVTPHLQTALSYTNNVKIKDQGYRLIFQCRTKPSSIQIPQLTQYYWVIQNRYDLRPYGIILIKEKNFQKIQETEIPGGMFKYEKFQQLIQNNQK